MCVTCSIYKTQLSLDIWPYQLGASGRLSSSLRLLYLLLMLLCLTDVANCGLPSFIRLLPLISYRRCIACRGLTWMFHGTPNSFRCEAFRAAEYESLCVVRSTCHDTTARLRECASSSTLEQLMNYMVYGLLFMTHQAPDYNLPLSIKTPPPPDVP